MITLSVICLAVVVLLVAVFAVLSILSIPFVLVFSILPWVLAAAGVVLLLKALSEKPLFWENFIPAGVAFVAAGVLRWLF